MGEGVAVADGRATGKGASGASLPALDGLRAVAIILVLWHHLAIDAKSDIYRPAGLVQRAAEFAFTGVLLFFVLSGYLLFRPYARALAGRGPWPSAPAFYRRRALRILPLHLAVLGTLAALLYLPPLLLHRSTPLPTTLPANGNTARGFPVVALLGQEIFPDNGVGTLNPPIWSLAIEMYFYIALPWIALGLRRLGRRWMLGLVAFAALTFAVRMLLVAAFYQGWAAPFAALTVPSFDSFALGMLVAALAVIVPVPSARSGILAGTLGAAALVLCGAWFRWADVFRHGTGGGWGLAPAHGWTWSFFGPEMTTLAWAAVLWAALSWRPLIQMLSLRPLVFIGTISYSIYLWHYPMVEKRPIALVVIPAVLVVATISYYAIERPFLRRRAAAPPAPSRARKPATIDTAAPQVQVAKR